MAMSAGGISAYLSLDTGRFDTGLKSAQSNMDGFENKLKSGSQMATNVGKTMTKRLSVPILGVAAASAKLGMDFESEMSSVQALSGATGTDMEALEAKAREMGKATIFSATEAAEGMQYMALAGWDTNQMIEGLEPSLLLAGAANMELGRATDIVTDTMSMFGMEAEEATKMTDMLAYAQANSNTDVEQLGEALKYSGAAANAMGYDLADTTALLGTFADQGLKGSAAGTTLNRMFVDMKEAVEDGKIAIGETNVEVVDSQGNYKDMAEILSDVEEATKDMTMAERDAALGAIFGVQSIKGLNMILEAGTDTLKDFEDGIRGSDGAAKDMYDTMQDNLKGSVEELKSALGEAGLSLSETLNPMLRNAAEYIIELTNKFNALDDETKEFIVKAGLMVAAAGPVLMVIGSIGSGIGSVVSIGGSLLGLLTPLAGGLAGAAAPAGALGGALGAGAVAMAPWIAGAVAVGAAAYHVGKKLREDAIPEVEIFGDEVSESTKQAVGAFLEMEDETTQVLNQLVWSGKTLTKELKDELSNNYNEMGRTISEGLDKSYQDNLESMNEYVMQSKKLSQEEKDQILKDTEELYKERKQTVDEGTARINKILDTASEENRRITKAEQEEINEIQEFMSETAIEVLSDSAVEQQAILESLERQSGEITARQAAEVVKNSVEQKEKTISEAEAQEKETIAAIIRQRDEHGTISAEQADKLIEEAIRQKEQTVAEAESQHELVIREAKAMSGELDTEIDWVTGEVKTKWQSLTSRMGEIWGNLVDDAKSWGSNLWNSLSSGMDENWGMAESSGKNLASSVSRGFKHELAIYSPSRVFIEHGRNIVMGVVIGIKEKASEAVQATRTLAGQIISVYDKFGDAVITALRNRYTEEQRLQEDNIRKQITEQQEAERQKIRIFEDAHARKLLILDTETSAELKALQDRIDGINKKTEEEEKQLREEEYQKRLSDKEKELQEATSQEARLRIQEEINTMKAQREREHLLEERRMKIESLRDEMTNIREQAEEKRQAEEKELKRVTENIKNQTKVRVEQLEEQMEETKNHYEELLKEENLQAEARTLILAENNDELIQLLDSYNPLWQDAGQSFGESLLEGLRSTKKSIQKEVADILKLVGIVDKNAARINNSAAIENANIRRAQSDWQIAHKAGDTAAMDAAHRRAEEARRRGGTIPNHAQGTEYFKGGYTWVGEQGRELVRLPEGSKIKSNASSEKHIEQSRQIVQHLTINTPKHLSPSEVARKNLIMSRQLASEWGG